MGWTVLEEREEPLGHAEAECGRHAVLHRADVLFVQTLCLGITGITHRLLLLEARALILRIVELAKALAYFAACDKYLHAFDDAAVLAAALCEGLHVHRDAGEERRTRDAFAYRLPEMIYRPCEIELLAHRDLCVAHGLYRLVLSAGERIDAELVLYERAVIELGPLFGEVDGEPVDVEGVLAIHILCDAAVELLDEAHARMHVAECFV